jgi:hypothetical protein
MKTDNIYVTSESRGINLELPYILLRVSDIWMSEDWCPELKVKCELGAIAVVEEPPTAESGRCLACVIY